MAIYGVCEEGIRALRQLTERADESYESIIASANNTETYAMSHVNVLGPNISELIDALQSIKSGMESAAEPVSQILSALRTLADDYEEIFSAGLSLDSQEKENSGKGKSASLFGRVFGKDSDSSAASAQQFSDLPVEKLNPGGSTWVIKGDGYEKYKNHWDNADDYTFDRSVYGDDGKVTSVDSGLIEGVHIDSRDIESPDVFWGMHKGDGTGDYFDEIASHIPDVQAALDRGATLEEVLNDPVLGESATQYFRDPIKVYEGDGFYEFDGDGRHRIIAAKRHGIRVPVLVIGKIVRKNI